MKSWELEQMWRKEAREEGLTEGRLEGKIQFILDLLSYTGDVPEALKEKITAETDSDTLTKWHKLAAKADSISAFEKSISD